MADGERKAQFSFQLLNKTFPTISGRDNDEMFRKWGIKGRMKCQMFTFDQSFQPYQKDDFVKDFFMDPSVVSRLEVVGDKSCAWSTIGQNAESVTAQIVPCSTISMSFFDRLSQQKDESHIVPIAVERENGEEKKKLKLTRCFDEFYDDFNISDELRKMLLLDDCDNYCLYSDTEREEFMFVLFRHLCLGGRICQYEDFLDPYLDMTKQIYKDLITVQKNAETKELHVVSNVFKVTASNKDGLYYPGTDEHQQTFSYLIVDPIKRHVTVFYNKFGVGEVE